MANAQRFSNATTLVICMLTAFNCFAQRPSALVYPDANHPVEGPQVFAPGVISNPGSREGSLSFSPDGKSIFFTRVEANKKLSVYEMSFIENEWTVPHLWQRSDSANNSEAFVAPDSEAMYFISNRHAPNEKGSGRIWISARQNGNWSPPRMLELGITTDKGLWFPTVSADHRLYFGAYLDSIGNYGKSDIYVVDLTDKPFRVVNLGHVINSPHEEWDPYIAPDGSYLLFESDRPGGYGRTDIYVSFNIKGQWQPPLNLGAAINTEMYEVAAKVSPDGQYIFFDRSLRDEQDVHWVAADILMTLKKRATGPGK